MLSQVFGYVRIAGEHAKSDTCKPASFQSWYERKDKLLCGLEGSVFLHDNFVHFHMKLELPSLHGSTPVLNELEFFLRTTIDNSPSVTRGGVANFVNTRRRVITTVQTVASCPPFFLQCTVRPILIPLKHGTQVPCQKCARDACCCVMISPNAWRS